MKLLEYQGKELFKKVGIPVAAGQVAATPEEAEKLAQKLGKVVIKAQVLVGGRGKAGGIKLANTPEEARRLAAEILGSQLKGETVKQVLVTRAVDIEKEFYLGMTIDRAAKQPVIIFSPKGGVDIEEVAQEEKEAIFKFHVNPLEGLQPYQIRNMLFGAKIESRLFKPLYQIIEKLYQAFTAYEVILVEINPLALTDGGLLAIDAKFIVDDDALPRLPSLAAYSNSIMVSPQEQEAFEADLQYVKLEGNIGIIGNGAGLVMATLDVVKLMGGKPANFLDIGGGATALQMKKALELLLRNSAVEGIFINIFGGITRCDEVAKGLVAAKEELKINRPMVVRLTGTNEEEGRKILERSGIAPVASLEEGAKAIVGLVG